MNINAYFSDEEQLILLEAARVALADGDTFDMIADNMDFGDEELSELRERFQSAMNKKPETEWEKKKEAYIKNGYSKCPYCQSDHIEGDAIEVDCDYAWQTVRCVDCNKAWEDIYKLVDVEEKE